MPSLDFASGVIGGYFDRARAERNRREDAARFAIDSLIRSGRVSSPEDLRPFFDLLGESSLFGSLRGGKGKAGGGGGAGKGKQDPYALVSAITGPIFKGTTQAQPQQARAQGQPAPSTPPPAGPAGAGTGPSPAPAPAPPQRRGGGVFAPFPSMPRLLTNPEMVAQEMEARRAQGAVDTETDLGKQQAEQQQRERAIDSYNTRVPESQRITGRDKQEFIFTGKWPTGSYRPVNLPGVIKGSDLPEGTIDAFGQPKDDKRSYRAREVDGVKEFFPVVPAGAGTREVGQALQDEITKQLIGMGVKKTYQEASEEERNRAVEQIYKRDQTKRDLEDETRQQMMAWRAQQMHEKQQQDADEDALADAVVVGKANPMIVGGFGMQRTRIMGKALRKYKDATGETLDLNRIQLRFLAAQRAVTAMEGPQQQAMMAYASRTAQTIDNVVALARQLKQGNVQLFNRAKRSTATQLFSNTPYAQTAVAFDTYITAAQEEFAVLVRLGYAPTDPAYKLAQQQINADLGLDALTRQMTELRQIINFGLNAYQSQLERALTGQPPIPSPIPIPGQSQPGGTTLPPGGQPGNPLGLTFGRRPGQ